MVKTMNEYKTYKRKPITEQILRARKVQPGEAATIRSDRMIGMNKTIASATDEQIESGYIADMGDGEFLWMHASTIKFFYDEVV